MPRTTTELPDALDNPDLRRRLGAQPIALFLDYDGTLTPIVARPELAVLADNVRTELERVAARCFVGIISGRDLADVRAMFGGDESADRSGGGATEADHLWFAGSHGFDVAAPDGTRTEFEEAHAHLDALGAAADDLERALVDIPGAWVERKRFAVATHFRQVDDARVPDVEEAVDRVLGAHEGLRKTGGKRIFELRPDVAWDKGRALWSLFERAGLARDDDLAVFIGDDVTDEDAFVALGDDGIGLVVADEARPTDADYRLSTPDDVRAFLAELATLLEGAAR
ncbi:MAG: trehalose-phosphatase [Acidimicrobiia bacterium]|nr:trehalose-phosphatase [Acidimicrobiia bacterium]